MIPRMVTSKRPAERVNDQNKETAADKLARQRAMVRTWDLYLSYDETSDREGDEGAGVIGPGVPEWHLRCMECGQSVTRVYTGGNPVAISVGRIHDDYVRHALQSHERILLSDD